MSVTQTKWAALRWLADRLDERTTWAALGVGLSLIGVNLSPTGWDLIVQAGMSLAALVLFVTREAPRDPPLPPIVLVGRADVDADRMRDPELSPESTPGADRDAGFNDR